MKKLILSLGLTLLFFNVFSQQLFENLPSTGEVEVTLHPGTTITAGSTHLVSFGVPFPRNTVTTISQIVVTDPQGNELPSDIKEITRWHSLSDDPDVDGVRAALLYVNIQFSTITPLTIKVVYGQNRTLELGDQGDVRDTWVSTELGVEDEYPQGEGLMEPAVYATLPASWLDKSVLRTRVVPQSNVSTAYQWHHDAKINFGNTMIDEVAETVTIERVDVTVFSQWLYDRALTLWNNYIATGELKWLRASHKATEYYSKELHPDGYFIPKFESNGIKDLKYSYGGSMLIDIMLTGDTSLLTKIEQVASFANTSNQTLTNPTSMWTERNFSYWVLASLSAYEATGNVDYKNQVNTRMDHIFDVAKNPINGWTAEGGVLHSVTQHEGGGTTDPIISPWMSALLSDAVWRYYLHSEDNDALEFLISLADNVVNHCLYEPETLDEGTPVSDMYVPYYLASGQLDPINYTNDTFKSEGNVEHTKDVLGLIARGIWARKKLNISIPNTTSEKIPKMVNAALFDIDLWTRTATDRPRYRLRPFRKYNWWFGTTSDLEWLMTNNPNEVLNVDGPKEDSTNDFVVYPNPAQNNITIITNNTFANTNGKIKIYDLSGKVLKTTNIKNLSRNPMVTIDDLSPGVYFLRIITHNQTERTTKLIKK